MLGPGVRGARWLGRARRGVGGIGVAQPWVALCLRKQGMETVRGLRSEAQDPWKEPKMAEKPSEKQPTGLPPGALPGPTARPLPASLWCEGPRSRSSSRRPRPPERLRFVAAHVCALQFASWHLQGPNVSGLFFAGQRAVEADRGLKFQGRDCFLPSESRRGRCSPRQEPLLEPRTLPGPPSPLARSPCPAAVSFTPLQLPERSWKPQEFTFVG